MDAIALLERDHRTVEGLFRRYEIGDVEQRTQIVHEIIRELSVHAAIEEQILYPQVKDVLPDGRSLAGEAVQEHQEAKEVLAELDRMDAAEPGFDPKVRSLIADVRHHVEEEETEMLPKLRSALPQSRLDELGQMMEKAKAMAPTRPHPHAPSTPPANVAAGAVAGMVDRVRDTVSGRSEPEPPSRPKRATSSKKAPARKTSSAKTGTRRASSAGRRKGPVIEVTSDPRGGWRADKRGASRASARSDSKQEVVKRARELAKAQGARLVIHGQDGRIQEERTYADDPARSRG